MANELAIDNNSCNVIYISCMVLDSQLVESKIAELSQEPEGWDDNVRCSYVSSLLISEMMRLIWRLDSSLCADGHRRRGCECEDPGTQQNKSIDPRSSGTFDGLVQLSD